MWRWFHGKFGDLGDPENLDDAIDALMRYKRLAPLEADWERCRREFDDGPPTYGRLFDLPIATTPSASDALVAGATSRCTASTSRTRSSPSSRMPG